MRSSKEKGEMSLRGQVEGVLEMCTLQNKMGFKARSKSMECCICSQYHENDGTPRLSCSFGEESIVTKASIIGD